MHVVPRFSVPLLVLAWSSLVLFLWTLSFLNTWWTICNWRKTTTWGAALQVSDDFERIRRLTGAILFGPPSWADLVQSVRSMIWFNARAPIFVCSRSSLHSSQPTTISMYKPRPTTQVYSLACTRKLITPQLFRPIFRTCPERTELSYTSNVFPWNPNGRIMSPFRWFAVRISWAQEWSIYWLGWVGPEGSAYPWYCPGTNWGL